MIAFKLGTKTPGTGAIRAPEPSLPQGFRMMPTASSERPAKLLKSWDLGNVPARDSLNLAS